MKKTNPYAKAGKELMKLNLGSAVKSFASGLIGTFSSTGVKDGVYFLDNGGELHFKFSGHDSATTAYTKCAPVPAIINRMAKAYINGKTWILDKDGKDATSKEAEKIKKLLRRPNPFQSWKEFEAQAYIYKKLFGYTIILPIKPYGFPNIEATSLWNIPPFLVDIEETNQLFYQKDAKIIKQLVLKYKGTRTTLQADDVYIMKDVTPSFDSIVIPESPIKALEMQINNIIGAYESRNVLINYRGALGILSPEKDQYGAVPVEPNDKEALQKDFQRYGLKKSQWQVIISKAALKWQPMGYATKDLMLFEEIEDDVMRLCDQFNYPYRLLSSNKTNSLGGSDLDPYKKLLYHDAIIPEAESDYEAWSEFFNCSAYGLTLNKDFSHVPVLQADKKNDAEARKVLNEALKVEWEADILTLNQWLVKLGEDPIGPDGDLRRSQMTTAKTMLAVTIGVGGIQGLIAVISDSIMSEEAKQATLEIVFNLSPEDAARMVKAKKPESSAGNNNNVNEETD